MPTQHLSAAPAAGQAGQAAPRQPVLDTARALYGYELLLHEDAGAARQFLRGAEASRLADSRLLFLPAHPAWLQEDALGDLPGDGLVLQIPAAENDDPERIVQLVPALRRLRDGGAHIALPRAALKKAYAPWLELAAFVKVDGKTESRQLEAVLSFLERHTPAQAIATGVDSHALFEQLQEQGVPLFQGNWFARLPDSPKGSLQPGQAVVMQLINLLQRDAEIDEIAPLLKRDPSLSVSLLRIINSAAMGLSFEVTSLQHALLLLGRKRLFRWAASLMVIARSDRAAPATMHAALVRGRLMELLAADLLPPEQADNAFVTGIFSLLDVILDMPLPAALDALALPEAVADALLREQGLFAPLLALTVACERNDEAEFARGAETLQLSNHQVNWAHLQALAWAEELALAP